MDADLVEPVVNCVAFSGCVHKAGHAPRSATPKGKRMIDLSTLISFLTGLGVGSIATTIIKYLLDQKFKAETFG